MFPFPPDQCSFNVKSLNMHHFDLSTLIKPSAVVHVSVCVSVSLPETALGGLRTELPSGGLSPTMLGSWAPGGGEYAGGLDPCSWSNFFGTLR